MNIRQLTDLIHNTRLVDTINQAQNNQPTNFHLCFWGLIGRYNKSGITQPTY